MSPASTRAFDTICAAKIREQPTEFVFKRFANKYFLIITQYQKMINLFTVKIDNQNMAELAGNLNGLLDTIPLTINSDFGQDTDEIRSAITYLVNNSNLKFSPTEIVISLGLKEINGKCLRETCQILNTFLPKK